MKDWHKVSTFVIVVLSLLSCATMIHGTKQTVAVSSDPNAAKVTVDGQVIGVTPYVNKLSRKSHHVILIQKDGYREQACNITRKMSGWILLDLLWLPLGTIVAGGIDFIAGGAWKLEPENISVFLEPVENSGLPPLKFEIQIRNQILTVRNLQ